MKRLRPYFLETAVEYEWDNFKNSLKENKVALHNTVRWLHGFQQETKVEQETVQAADFFVDAFVNLVSDCRNSHRARQDLPETFKLDMNRLLNFHNDWQDICIMSILIMLYRQFNGGKADFQQATEMKQQLWVLLNDQDTTMRHIALHIASSCGKNRDKPFTDQEVTMVHNMIDKNLQTDAKVFELFYKRIGEQLMEFLKRKTFKEREVLAQQGLLEVEPELLELAERMRAVLDHNKAVYAKVYNQIIQTRKVQA
jgi:hypothetical protein